MRSITSPQPVRQRCRASAAARKFDGAAPRARNGRRGPRASWPLDDIEAAPRLAARCDQEAAACGGWCSPRLAAGLDAVVEAGGVAHRAGADLGHRAAFGDGTRHAIAARRLVAGGTRGADLRHGGRAEIIDGHHRQRTYAGDRRLFVDEEIRAVVWRGFGEILIGWHDAEIEVEARHFLEEE